MHDDVDFVMKSTEIVTMPHFTSPIRRNCFLAITVIFASIAVFALLVRPNWVEATLQLNPAHNSGPFEWIDNQNIAILELGLRFPANPPRVLSGVRVQTDGRLEELATAPVNSFRYPPRWTTEPDYGDAIYLRAYSGWVSLGYGTTVDPRIISSVDALGKRSFVLQTSNSVIGCIHDDTVVMLGDLQSPQIGQPLLINYWKAGEDGITNLAAVKFPTEPVIKSAVVSPDGRYVAFQLYGRLSNLSERLQEILYRFHHPRTPPFLDSNWYPATWILDLRDDRLQEVAVGAPASYGALVTTGYDERLPAEDEIRWSPDSRRFAYTTWDVKHEVLHVWSLR